MLSHFTPIFCVSIWRMQNMLQKTVALIICTVCSVTFLINKWNNRLLPLIKFSGLYFTPLLLSQCPHFILSFAVKYIFFLISPDSCLFHNIQSNVLVGIFLHRDYVVNVSVTWPNTRYFDPVYLRVSYILMDLLLCIHLKLLPHVSNSLIHIHLTSHQSPHRPWLPRTVT